MQRVLVAALLASAFAVSAQAEPISLRSTLSDTLAAKPAAPTHAVATPNQRVSMPDAAADNPAATTDIDAMAWDAPSAAATPAQYASADRAQMGGGFIEFLFGGAQRTSSPRYQGTPGYRVEQGPQPAPIYGGRDPADAGDPRAGEMDPKYLKQPVSYDGAEPAGTIIINTRERFLYLVEGHGEALRYGIGVGRPGFTWAGVHHVSSKREWPDWRPPDDMLKRRPDLPRFMAGGPDNPLGARAMYLGSTLYRIHGSNEPWTIGHAVSSGCIRMRNEDVIDLYSRVSVGAKVIVI